MPLRAFISFPRVAAGFGGADYRWCRNALAGIYFISTDLEDYGVIVDVTPYVVMPLRAFISFPRLSKVDSLLGAIRRNALAGIYFISTICRRWKAFLVKIVVMPLRAFISFPLMPEVESMANPDTDVVMPLRAFISFPLMPEVESMANPDTDVVMPLRAFISFPLRSASAL